MKNETSLRNVSTIIVNIITILGVSFGLLLYLDNRVKSTMNDEQFIKKVASHVRPYVIFDANETIHVDGGAMQYLEKIEVKQVVRKGKAGSRSGLDIIITPKSHLAYAPALETITPTMFYVTHKRGSRHQWIYELTPGWTVTGPDDKEETDRFRLEILR